MAGQKMLEEILRVAFIIAISYLWGAIPTAYVIGRLRNINVFEFGSGNMGATNIMRALGLGWGMLTWFFDSSKGIVAVLIAVQIMPHNPVAATVLAALAAIAGHNWSLFVAIITGTLRGGKGAAVTFGTLLLVVPLHIIAIMLFICGVIVAVTRYMSLGVLIMFTFGMGWIVWRVGEGVMPWEYTFYAVIALLLLYFRFQENIKRLLNGTERRMFERATSKT
ncbi:MAG: glycerol-3-phosphate acyltransferase [Chloroflexota bacterium]|nr:glycerol-3-phosphate acyltransferase [Chloroflexota bacterium]